MAKNQKKKYKNIKIEQNELQPVAIGMFESRKKSSIGTFLILAIFILTIFFLPQISTVINDYLNPAPVNPDKPSTPDNKDNTNVDDDKEEEFYAYADNLKITKDDVMVDTISVDKENNTLSYTVTNNGNSKNMEELNYYIELYDSDKTLLERVKLASNLSLASGSFKNLTKPIKATTAASLGYIVLIKKTVSEYPDVSATLGEDGSEVLVCSTEHEKVTYKFVGNKLKSLTSIATYQMTDSDYEIKKEELQGLMNTYNTKVGIVSTKFDYDSGYSITTTVNLSEASRIYIFNADSFQLDTTPTVVKFEMEAQAFTCE